MIRQCSYLAELTIIWFRC